MRLKMVVNKQVMLMGKTPGSRKLILHNLLDNGRDICQFMQLFDNTAVETFYDEHAGEIDEMCTEDVDLLPTGVSIADQVRHALEKTLMLIEHEI